MNKNELLKILQDPKSSALNLIIVSAIISAIKNGDTAKAEYLFMRIIGKVTDKAEIILPEPFIIQTKDGGRINMGAKFDGKTIKHDSLTYHEMKAVAQFLKEFRRTNDIQLSQ